MKFQESKLAHKLLDGKIGIEIGAASHNPFGIAGCLNVDISANTTGVYHDEQVKLCGKSAHVDVIAPMDNLPFPDDSLDFVLSSHVLEHAYDPIGTIDEWLRVLKPGGLIFMIIPDKHKTFDSSRELTDPEELLYRNEVTTQEDKHWNVWDLPSFLAFCAMCKYKVHTALEVDDKVGNGFCVVLQK